MWTALNYGPIMQRRQQIVSSSVFVEELTLMPKAS